MFLSFLAAHFFVLVSAISSDSHPDHAFLMNAPEVAITVSIPSLRANKEHIQATSAADKQDYLTTHNAHRASAIPIPVPALVPLTWSSYMESEAQWLADQCSWGHQIRGTYGQNLGALIGAEPTPNGTINGLASEKIDYDYYTNTCKVGKVCGHYTQVSLYFTSLHLTSLHFILIYYIDCMGKHDSSRLRKEALHFGLSIFSCIWN